MDWSPVVADLRPGEQWTLADCTDPGTLVWLDGTPAPTPEEIEAHHQVMLARPPEA